MGFQPFSVAMSVYKNDKSEFIDRALQSITEQQTIIPNEIVLIVDGPVSDEIDAVIDKYSKLYPIFNVIRLQKNGGLGNALKLAVENAKYDLVARMDSDDVAVNDRFEQQLQIFEDNPDLGILGGNISEFIDKEDNIVAYRNVPHSDGEIKKYLKKRCPFNHMTVMFNKNDVIKAGNYQDFFWNEDYYLWIRMVEHGAIMMNAKMVLVNVRVGKDMYKRRGGWKYYKSEAKLQKYMLKHKIINFPTYLSNKTKRFIVQVLMPNSLRGWVFKKFARGKVNEEKV